ncbi:MAG: response regulator [Candidatus Methanoperedens sp.]|nr:response regulator [Candidatus Methanoperedens sp.]
MTPNKQILVVEDEAITAMDIQRRLKNLGYDVPAIVSSGEKAIEKVKENNPDLILMDINLNREMDGIEAAIKIHSFSDIPIIYLTAYSDDETLQRAKISEPYAYLIKPFKDRELLINIEIAFYKNKMEKKLKEGYEKLRESKKWLETAVDSIGDAVIATDKDGNIKLINPIAQALSGWNEKEALGKKLSTVFNVVIEGTDMQVEDPVKKVIKEGMFYGLADQTYLVSKNGMRTPVDIIGTPIRDEGSIVGIVLVFNDIIESKKIENLMRQYSS